MLEFSREHYDEVIPRDLERNLLFRRELLRLCAGAEGEEYREAVIEICARDPLFFIATFLWVFEPRRARDIPFIPWENQEEVIEGLVGSLGVRDHLVEKSRDQGASYLCLAVILWAWLFHRRMSFLLLSRKEELVWKAGDEKALFTKLEVMMRSVPEWMCEDWIITEKHMENRITQSTIEGDSTNKFAGVADRKFAILMDEFALVEEAEAIFGGTRNVSNCRIFNSTPRGTGNVFYRKDVCNDKLRRNRMHWSRNPYQNRGLYTLDEDYQVKLLDEFRGEVEVGGEKYKFPDNYPFVVKKDHLSFTSGVPGALRSPWYDNDCIRAQDPVWIAQELDISYEGSARLFFPMRSVNDLLAKCREPVVVGDLQYNDDISDVVFVPDVRGSLRLWVMPDGGGRFVPGAFRYGAGADISQGTGASNSALSIGNLTLNEKIGEYVNPNIDPAEFARYTVAAMRWLRGGHGEVGKLIWDAGGPGLQFGRQVVREGFSHFWVSRDETSMKRKLGSKPGYWIQPQARENLLSEYRDGLVHRRMVNWSREAVSECLDYVFNDLGQVVHAGSQDADPSGARANHGDRVVADALLWHLMIEAPGMKRSALKTDVDEKRPVLRGSLAWRRDLVVEDHRAAREEKVWAV